MSFLRNSFIVGILQIIFVAIVLTLILALVDYLGRDQNGAKLIDPDLSSHGVLSVSVVAPRQLSYTPVLNLNGAVEASQTVSIAAQVGGQVRLVGSSFRSGGLVKKGELLFQIERDDYELALQSAIAEIAAASSSLSQLEAEAALAVQEWRDLYPGEQIPDLAARRPQIAAAKARLEGAKAARDQAQLSLQRTRVTAPNDLQIQSTTLSEGQIINFGQVVGVGFPIDSLEVNAPLSLDELSMISPAIGREVWLSSSSRSEVASGLVVREAAGLNPLTRLAAVFIAPENRQMFPVGSFVDVRIEGIEEQNAMAVPKSALSERGLIWVVSSGRLESRRVSQIGETDDELIVRRFFAADGVVVLPPTTASDGLAVKLREPAR